MILGSQCTRDCGFCAVGSSALHPPDPPDTAEPERIALAALEMGLRHVVITSVTRDDLPDGGAFHFSRTVREIKKRLPHTTVEVLTPDFLGDIISLKTVLDAGPDVFNHNIETVPRLYPLVRSQALYERSLALLRTAKESVPHLRIKSGIMVGLGETSEEVLLVIEDIASGGCDFLTIGQYLRPTKKHIPVAEYVSPETFEHYRKAALRVGFRAVISAPLARSSMNAEEMFLA